MNFAASKAYTPHSLTPWSPKKIDLQPWAVEIEKAVKTHGNHHNAPLVWQVASQDWRFSFVCTRAQLDSKDSFQSASFRVFLSPPD